MGAKFIQSGIQEIVYIEDHDVESDPTRASRILFEVAGVKMTTMKPSVSSITTSSSSEGRSGLQYDNCELNEEEMEKHLTSKNLSFFHHHQTIFSIDLNNGVDRKILKGRMK